MSGAERKARPRCLAMRAFTTTRRAELNRRVRLKLMRPRPKVERPYPALREAAVPLGTWPARLAARSTWLMKLLGLGARVEPMRPGLMRKSLSPSLMAGLRRAFGAPVPKRELKSLAKAPAAARVPTDRHAKSHAKAMACGCVASRFYLAVEWSRGPLPGCFPPFLSGSTPRCAIPRTRSWTLSKARSSDENLVV